MGRQNRPNSSGGLTFHSGRNVIEAIARTAARAKQRFAAVAYVTSATLFPFRAGDVLVVDMSRRALGQGNTNPWRLSELHQKHVHLFHRPALHAKVFVFGKRVAVGSANLSATSRTNEEAVLCMNGDEQFRLRVLNQIREWADPSRRITPAMIEDAKKHYRPPQGGGGQPPPSKLPTVPIWLLNTSVGAWPKGLKPQTKRAEERVRARIAKPLEYEPSSTLSWHRDRFFRSANVGDWVVETVRPRRGALEVRPPFRLARKEAVEDPHVADGATYFFTLEVRKDQEPVSARRFRRRLGEAGITGDLDGRCVRSQRGVDAIWSLWPEEALRRATPAPRTL
jgi:hypothetical protein